MITVVGSFIALPGKAPELIGVLKEAAALSKKAIGVDGTILRPVAGKVGEVLYVWQAANLAKYEEQAANIESMAEFKTITEKAAALVVPNTARWAIYRQV